MFFRRRNRTRIVVHGMPKSGTTALAKLLGAAAGIPVSSDPFYQLDKRGVEFRDRLYSGQLSLSELIRANRAAFRGGIVKDPNFIFLIDQVLNVFPHAGHVFIVRDPRDNIRSILNRLRLSGRPDGADLMGLSDTWGRVVEGRTPDVPGSNYLERLAHRWRLSTRSYLRHRDRMISVSYEEFDQAKEATIEEVLVRLSLRSRRNISSIVDRRFQPPGNRGVSWDEFFGREGLESIESICGAEMEIMGYERVRQ